jgi:integrase
MVTYQIMRYFAEMGRRRNQIPSRLLHRASGQDRIIFGGHTYYLGPHDSPESIQRYAEIIRNIVTTGEAVPAKSALTVATLAERYLNHIRSESANTGEPAAIARALKGLVELFGQGPAESIGTSKFLTLQATWAQRLTITTVNKYHGYVLNLFRWAGMNELVPSSVWHNLKTVPKLKPHRSAAKPSKVVGPVEWSIVERTLPHVSETVRDIILMQWYTGMRSGEVLTMTADQIGDDDVYRPRVHKNKWRGHVREVPLGPKALEIANRRTTDGLLFRGYSSASYGRAITRACEAHGIPRWHAHQLRHARSTDALSKHGVAAARALLGHKSLSMVSRYAAADLSDAKKAVADDG